MRYNSLVISAFIVSLSQQPASSEIDKTYHKTDQEIDQSWHSADAAKDQGVAAQRGSLNAILNRVSKLNQYSSSENIDYLGESLRKLARTNIYQLEERFEVFDQVQQKLLSISGHAQYFADKIERERATLSLEAYRETYDFNRRLAFETLSHLPSPETIKVLGEYLDDERDATKEAMWTSDGVLYGLDPNCKWALDALKRIGLRDPGIVEPEAGKWPSSEDYATRDEGKRAVYAYLVARRERQLKPWRAWYAELKAGKRTFSFKGQSVEYRFKPDGTVETTTLINPPNDALKPPKVDSSPRSKDLTRMPPASADKGNQNGGSSWSWIIGSLIASIAGAIWLRTKK